MKPRSNLLLYISTAVAIAWTVSVHGADYTWGGGNSIWTDTSLAGWNAGSYPINGDTVTINSGKVTTTWNDQTFGVNFNIGAATLDSGGVYMRVQNNTELQGATIIIGANAIGSGWIGGTLGGIITVSGSAASNIHSGSYVEKRVNMGTTTTFNVNDVATGTDLTVTNGLQDYYDGNSYSSNLVKDGAGTLELTGANSYTGNTTINGGTLKITEGASIYNGGWNGSAVLSVNNGGTLDLNRWGFGPGGANQSLGGLDFNPARFIIDGGMVRCTGGAAAAPTDPNESPYGPGFTIGALGATLDAAKPNDTWTVKYDSRGYGPIASNAGGTLTLTGVGNGVFDKELGGAGGLVMNGEGIWSLTRSNSYGGGTTVNSGTLLLDGSSGGVSRIRGALVVNEGATVDFANDDGTGLGWDVNAKISSLVVNGGTVTTPGGIHVWTAPVDLTGGTLRSNNGTTTTTGPQLEWSGVTLSTHASADPSVIAGRIRFRTDFGSVHGFNVADGPAADDLLVTAAITEAGINGMVKSGPGTMTLTGEVLLSGVISIVEGTLDLSSATLGSYVRVDADEIARLRLPTLTPNEIFISGQALAAGTWGPPGSVAAGAAQFESPVFTGSPVVTLTNTGPQGRQPGNANPVLPGYYADPSVVSHDGKFFVYATLDPWGGDTLGCWESPDFKHWTYRTLNWPTKAACTSPTSGGSAVWAPSVVQGPDGLFHMFVSVGNEVWVGVAAHPLGPWTDANGGAPLIPSNYKPGYHMIDAEAFVDDDGTPWLYWGSGHGWTNGKCWAVKLNHAMNAFDGEPLDVTPANYFEGPVMVKRHGIYFLMYSQGITISDTYQVHYATGNNPLGPFTEGPNSPILVTNKAANVISPGHHTIFNTQNKDYILYHRHSIPFVESFIGRQTCVDEIGFRADGTIQKVTPTHDGPALVHGRNPGRLPATATASSASGTLQAAKFVTDENHATLWQPQDPAQESWLQLDLGQPKKLSRMEIRMEYAWKPYRFTVQSSLDGNDWNTVADHSDTPVNGSPISIATLSQARFLRLIFPPVTNGIATPAVWEWATFSDYESWADANSLTGSLDDDDDHDGQSNFAEYAFGTAPQNPSSFQAITGLLNPSTGTLTYTRRTETLTGLNYSVWYSTNLSVWTQDTGAAQGTPVFNGEVETVPVTLSPALISNTKLFIQVRAE